MQTSSSEMLYCMGKLNVVCHFFKENNLCDCLLPGMTKPFQKRSTLKYQEEQIPLRADHHLKGGKYKMVKLLPMKIHLFILTLLHSVRPNLHRVLAVLSAVGLMYLFVPI